MPALYSAHLGDHQCLASHRHFSGCLWFIKHEAITGHRCAETIIYTHQPQECQLDWLETN